MDRQPLEHTGVNCYEETDGIVWVVDSADTCRLDEVKGELESVLQEGRLQGASLLILANKQDIKGSCGCSSNREQLRIEYFPKVT